MLGRPALQSLVKENPRVPGVKTNMAGRMSGQPCCIRTAARGIISSTRRKRTTRGRSIIRIPNRELMCFEVYLEFRRAAFSSTGRQSVRSISGDIRNRRSGRKEEANCQGVAFVAAHQQGCSCAPHWWKAEQNRVPIRIEDMQSRLWAGRVSGWRRVTGTI